MKKIFKSKGFLVTVLSVSCIAILAVCWLAGRDTRTAFLPDEQPPDIVQEEWKDTPDTAEDSWEHAGNDILSQNGTEEKLEEYPKVTEETDTEVVIDFVPEETKNETPPPPPEGQSIMADSGDGSSVSQAQETGSSSSGSKTDNPPSAGSTNENGAVYDPVFGWVVPGQVNQYTADSSGDPNKMVGNMGN